MTGSEFELIYFKIQWRVNNYSFILCDDHPPYVLKMPLLPPKGPYAVSTLTIEVPGGKYAKNLIRSPFHYKNDSAKIDPFQFQTTLVTLFYPTLLQGKEKSEKATFSSSASGKPISWLNE